MASVSQQALLMVASQILLTSSTDTWNSADKTAGMILSNSDRTVTSTSGGNGGVRTIGSHSAGKYYFEILTGTFDGTIFDNDGLGIITGTQGLTTIPQGAGSFWVRTDGLIYVGAASTTKSTNAIVSATIGFAIDLTAQRAWVRNSFNANDWIGTTSAPTPDPATGVDGFDVSSIFGVGVAVFPCMSGDNSSTDVATFNQTLTYAIPSGFSAW